MAFKKRRDGSYVSDSKGTFKLPPGDSLTKERPAVEYSNDKLFNGTFPLTTDGKVDWQKIADEKNKSD